MLAADADEGGGAALRRTRHLPLAGVAEAAGQGEAEPEGELHRPDATDGRTEAGGEIHERQVARRERLVGVAADGGLEVQTPVRVLPPVDEAETGSGGGDDAGPAELGADAGGGEHPPAHLVAEVGEPEVEAVDARVGRGVAAGQLLVVGDQDEVERALARVDEGLAGRVDLLVVVERVDVLPVEGDLLLQGAVARGETDDRRTLDRRAGEGAHRPLLAGADVRRARLLEPDARHHGLADAHRDLRPHGARAGHVLEHLAAGDAVAVRAGGLALAGGLREGGAGEGEGQGEDEGGDGTTRGTDLHGDDSCGDGTLTGSDDFLQCGRHETEPSQLILSLWSVTTRK